MTFEKKMTASLLAVLLVTGIHPVSIFAAEKNTPKEEVVYINLNADGIVKEIHVVNSFELEKDSKIIDYGAYETLRNMTTTDDIAYKDNKVTIDAKTGKLYYEGKLKEPTMPWDISIKYYMDGKEYSADKIAGLSGNLEIKLSIRQNPNCDSSFFEGYALQASLTLDTNKARHILGEGATIANVGSDKQLTYTILPNTEKDITISATVKDFEMGGISINGIRMNLDIDLYDAALQEKIDEVIGAIHDLDKGADKVNTGASDLYDASGKLTAATEDLYTAVGSLNEGAAELKKGLTALTSKSTELTGAAWSAYEALCSAAQIQVNAQLEANGLEKVTLTPAVYSEVLLSILEYMDADTVYHTAYDTALAEVTSEAEAQADTLYTSYIQSQAGTIYLSYVQSQAETLYTQVAAEAVMRQLIESGDFNEDQASAYLTTEEGKALIQGAAAAMSDEQKEQIIMAAAGSLTVEQKQQILQGAITSLTEEQKAEIRNTCIQQMMASDEVTAQINEAVKKVNSAAAQVSALKGQLDNYGAFYNGLADYTNAVSSAANGASALTDGLHTLYSNTDTLKKAVGDLHIAVGTLKDGTGELKNGTGEFVSETDGMDTRLSDEIQTITSSATGKDVETVSFVSEQNTNINSVQFVIQTESIELDIPADAGKPETEHLNFWQKLLRLFRLY
ncbi:hypothetical protein [Lactonifactor longoviformis]|uniref:hypothetical protein n=1 Tax=Lactonifactor longoviformis TaxID=341220 RepID=UPI0036F27C6F